MVPVMTGCQTASTHSAKRPVSEVWRVDAESSATPPVWFSFPKPFESYAGEFPRVDGELRIGDDATTGWFRVSITEVTLGEEELDRNVRSNTEMLAGSRFPRSTFTVLAMVPPRPGRSWPVDVVLHAELELKGIRMQVTAPAVLTFESGKTARLRGGFSIESLREKFDVVGPGVDGEPAGNRVEVMFDVSLKRDASNCVERPGERT
jgi:polyisoprenoid-binding protein YceI